MRWLTIESESIARHSGVNVTLSSTARMPDFYVLGLVVERFRRYVDENGKDVEPKRHAYARDH